MKKSLDSNTPFTFDTYSYCGITTNNWIYGTNNSVWTRCTTNTGDEGYTYTFDPDTSCYRRIGNKDE